MAVVIGIALMPIGLVQRYRSGTSRRLARSWLAKLNIGALAISVLLFLGTSALTNFWVPNALTWSLAGLAAGSITGLVGLALTKWEPSAQQLHYTPNRFLVLAIILVVLARILYAAWRLTQGWDANNTWLRESGIPGSMAAGALVLGYTLTYWIGLARQIRRHRP